MDKTIICIPKATIKQLKQFSLSLNNNQPIMITNLDCKVYRLVDDKLVEVVNTTIQEYIKKLREE